MRKFEIHILFMNGDKEKWTRTEDEIKSFGNVNKLVFDKWPTSVREIKVNEVGGSYQDLTFNYTFEQWAKTGIRVEAENDPGYEDLTGYGSRTDGKINRFYLGRSTGFIPIYIEVLNRNSHGGCALMHEHRKLKGLYHLDTR